MRLLVGIAGICLFGCEEDPRLAPEPPPGLVMEIDGLQIWAREIEPWVAYVETVDRRTGRDAAIRGILDNHLIPLKLAQRAWAEPRDELRRRAEALARVVRNGGYPELVAKGRAVAGEPLAQTTGRLDLPLPIGAWAFDEDRIGHVSPLLETPQGFSLFSTYRIERGITRTVDRVEAYQVPFYTHPPVEFAAWLVEARAAVSDKVTYVHPGYRRALPPWVKLP
jgi:hypothetical protein